MHSDWSISYIVWFIVPVNQWKNRASSELLYKSNRPQVSMGYRLIKSLGMLEEFINHGPAAHDLQTLLVFYQHPAWFISL